MTNPKMDAYETFIHKTAADEKQEWKPENALGHTFVPLIGNAAVDTIVGQTVRSNFYVCSLYKAPVGDEQIRILGVMKHFFILKRPELNKMQQR